MSRVSDTWRSHSRAALELHALTSPWPFSVWGIDIIGKISPKSSSGHEFILVAIDYFTKWVEAASYARLTSSGVASFIRSHIICRYGVPHELISDRGVHFRAEVDTLVQRYSIRHHRSTAYRPQTNGAVEAANKNIKRILRKMVETSRDWSRSSLSLAVLPVEIEMGSLRVALEQQIPETDWAQARFDQLNLLDERRLRAADHVRAYQRKMARAFKKRVKPDHCMELTPEGAAWLMDLDGNQFSEPTNVDQLKRHHWVHGSRDLLYLLHFIHEGMGFDHRVFELSFPSFLSPYHPSLHYVPCLKTTLRPWIRYRLLQLLCGQVFEIDAILGHIPFRRIFMDFAEVTCSRIDDSMLSDLRPILHFDAIQGHISVRMRFTDHEGVACLSLFARSRFILFDIVVIPGWGYVECLDPTSSFQCAMEAIVLSHVRRSSITRPRYIVFASLTVVPELFIDMSLVSGVQSRRSFTVYDIQSHHVTFFSSVFRATSQFDVQSHHHHFLVSAFRAITLLSFGVQSRHRFSDRRSESRSRFRRSESLSLLSFGVQSHHHYFSVSAFRAFIDFQIDIQQSHPQFRRSEPSSVFRSTFRVAFSVSAFRVVSSLLSLTFRVIIITSQFRRSELSSVFRRHSESHPRFQRSESLSLLSLTFRASRVITVILFRLPESLSSSCLGFQSHYYHLVWASRATTVILFRLPEPPPSSRLGFQSHCYHLV
ncbi:Pol polyprotein [Vitis vinifera]|uniref:Pol polyprotein n=1 Tax=Vitis vinifera TaxID=29760 RepID=A0A438CCM7_VITVI|nr:Pol polyprotein [Vitis vinifera]